MGHFELLFIPIKDYAIAMIQTLDMNQNHQ